MNYLLLNNLDKVKQILEEVSIVALDIETCTNDKTGVTVYPREGLIRLIQINDGKQIYIVDCFQHNKEDLIHTFQRLADKELKLVIQNAKFEVAWFKYHFNIKLNSYFDTYLASKLLDFEADADLGSIIKRYLHIDVDKSEQVSNWGGHLTKSQLEYAAIDVEHLIPLREKMLAEMREKGLLQAAKLEFDCVPAVANMELAGFPVNRDRFKAFIAKTEIERDEAFGKLNHFLLSKGGKEDYEKTYVVDLFGNEVSVKNEHSVNLRSQQQLLQSFKDAGIEIDSTDKKLISVYAQQNPDLNLLLKFRELEKLCSTYGHEMLAKNVKLDDRIYGNFLQMGAVTSRFASRNPNLQNAPRTKDFRDIFAPKDVRKFVQCLDANTFIPTNLGLVRIKNLNKDIHHVLQEDSSYAKISHKVSTGFQEVFEIITAHGYSVNATNNHQFQVLNSSGTIVWKRTDELLETDYMLLKPNYKFSDSDVFFPDIEFNHHGNNRDITVPKILDSDFAELLGLLVGDGSFENLKVGVVKIVVNLQDIDLIDRVKYLLLRYFNSKAMQERVYSGVHEFIITSKLLVNWLKLIGLTKQNLPEFIFSSKKEYVSAFLRGYFEADGSIFHKDGCRSGGNVTLASSRSVIIREVHSLLLSFGILSTCNVDKPNGFDKKFKSTNLSIAKSFSERYQADIGFISSRKREKLARSVSSRKKAFDNYGGIPNLKSLVKKHWALLKYFKPARNIMFGDNSRTLTRTYVADFIDKFPKLVEDFHVKYLQDGYNCYFVKVKSVKSNGLMEVFDITVPETSKFLANGFVTHNCDYSGFELRALADYSQDPVMLDAFANGRDLHSVTCSNLFSIDYADCKKPENSEKRTSAKIVNFSIAYGIGPDGLSLRLKGMGIDASPQDCEVYIKTWYDTYAIAGKWLKKQRYLAQNAAKGKSDGAKAAVYLRALDNRIIKSSFIVGDFSGMAGTKRDCMNFLIQCSNALATKRALIEIDKELEYKFPTAHIVNVIHDEIIVECDEKDAEAVKEIVERCMVDAAKYYLKTVNIEAEAKIMDSWGEK